MNHPWDIIFILNIDLSPAANGSMYLYLLILHISYPWLQQVLSIRWHKHPCCQIGQHGLFHQTHHRDPEQWPAILPVTFSVLPPAFCWWWASQWSIILMSQTWILQGMSTLQIRKSQPCKQFLTYSNLLYWFSLRKWYPLTWTCTWNFSTDINGHASNLVLSG